MLMNRRRAGRRADPGAQDRRPDGVEPPAGRPDLTELSRSLFSESTNAGVGFGLGFAVVFDPPQTLIPCSLGEFYWGGAASTAFWVDPIEERHRGLHDPAAAVVAYPIRRELRTLVYSALMETNG